MDIEIIIKFEAESNRVETIPKVEFVDIPCAANAVMTVNGEEQNIPDILRLYLDEVSEGLLSAKAEIDIETMRSNGE